LINTHGVTILINIQALGSSILIIFQFISSKFQARKHQNRPKQTRNRNDLKALKCMTGTGKMEKTKAEQSRWIFPRGTAKVRQ